jgi:hypothetical protein
MPAQSEKGNLKFLECAVFALPVVIFAAPGRRRKLVHPAKNPVESKSRWSWNLASLLWPWKRKARMKISTMVIPLLVLAAPAFAQEMTLPYAQGNVNRFLEANKANKLPSVVLYNFNLESG